SGADGRWGFPAGAGRTSVTSRTRHSSIIPKCWRTNSCTGPGPSRARAASCGFWNCTRRRKQNMLSGRSGAPCHGSTPLICQSAGDDVRAASCVAIRLFSQTCSVSENSSAGRGSKESVASASINSPENSSITGKTRLSMASRKESWRMARYFTGRPRRCRGCALGRALGSKRMPSIVLGSEAPAGQGEHEDNKQHGDDNRLRPIDRGDVRVGSLPLRAVRLAKVTADEFRGQGVKVLVVRSHKVEDVRSNVEPTWQIQSLLLREIRHPLSPIPV